MPQSAEELRQVVTTSGAQRFEVRRSHREVAAGLQRQVQKCLDKALYRPTMVVSSRKAELHLQRRQAAEEGAVVLVADAWPVRRGRSAVQVYASSGYDPLAAAVKAWASGTYAGCPDMSKVP
ncbi:MAG TPA: hypothetical protein VFM30_01015 [Steroidobacteraceae bacterium]|nr:hypothetical protein [Steroidobacteraceae bacterium]